MSEFRRGSPSRKEGVARRPPRSGNLEALEALSLETCEAYAAGLKSLSARQVAERECLAACMVEELSAVEEDAPRLAIELETLAAESQAATEASDIEDVEENEEELAERKAVSELVGWCVSKGAQGSGLSVLLPDDSGRGRGLEASRDIEVRSN